MKRRIVLLLGIWCLLLPTNWASSAPPPPAQSPPIVPTKPTAPRPTPPPAPAPPAPLPPAPGNPTGTPQAPTSEEFDSFGFTSLEHVTEIDFDGNELAGIDIVCGFSASGEGSEGLELVQFHLGSRTDGVNSVADIGMRISPAAVILGPLRLRASFALGLEHRNLFPSSSSGAYGLVGAEAALNLEHQLELVYGVDKRFTFGGETTDQVRIGIRFSLR